MAKAKTYDKPHSHRHVTGGTTVSLGTNGKGAMRGYPKKNK